MLVNAQADARGMSAGATRNIQSRDSMPEISTGHQQLTRHAYQRCAPRRVFYCSQLLFKRIIALDNPAQDLIVLKKICKELQKELAYAEADKDKVVELAAEARYLADCIGVWARKQ